MRDLYPTSMRFLGINHIFADYTFAGVYDPFTQRTLAFHITDLSRVWRRGRKGVHEPAYNAELALAYELASPGRKRTAAIEVARRHKREPEAALKMVQRIRQRGFTVEELASAPPALIWAYEQQRRKTLT